MIFFENLNLLPGRVHYFAEPGRNFERVYLSARKKESRLYPDEEAERLPFVSADNPHRAEWALRRQSFYRLRRYFQKRVGDGLVLDLGCGSGWLTRYLSNWLACKTLGLDINEAELQQAARLCAESNCVFAYGDIFAIDFPANTFQYIILNSVIQYFESLERLLKRLLILLKPGGEIHILDSPFYSVSELAAARRRSLQYYQKIDEEAMGQYYFHHSWASLASFSYEKLYPKAAFAERVKVYFGGKRNPFPWIKITAVV